MLATLPAPVSERTVAVALGPQATFPLADALNAPN